MFVKKRRKIIRRKKLKMVGIISGVILCVFLIPLLTISVIKYSHKEVFPNKENINYNYGFYHEDVEKDWSYIDLDTSNFSFKMHYKLSRATRTPFVAAFIAVKDSMKTLTNYQDHNTLRLHLTSQVGMRIPVMITFDYGAGETKKNGKPFPMVTLLKFIDYSEPGNYDIALDEMRIPDWWYRVHRLHREEVDLNKLTNVKGIVIGSCSILREKERDTIEIKKIEFFTDNSSLYWKVIGVISILTLLVPVVFFRKKIKVEWK